MRQIVLTTEQVNKLYEINIDTDNVPTINVDIDGAAINSSEIAANAKKQATNLGVDTYNLNIIPDTTTQNGENVELAGTGNTLTDKIDDFANQYQNVTNKANVVGIVNVDTNTLAEKKQYTKSAIEEMRATVLKNSGKVMTKEEFSKYILEK